MIELYNALTLCFSLLVEAMPFLLLGVILSSSLLFLIDEEQLISRLPKNAVLGAVVGSCIGFLFPVCECGNVPVARRLLLKRVSPSVAISFLLAAPTINPVVIWSTWVAFGYQPQIVVFRVVFSLAIAIVVGCVFSLQSDSRTILNASLAKRLSPVSLSPVTSQQQSTQAVPFLLQSGTFLIGKGQTRPMNTLALSAEKPVFIRRWRDFLANVIQEFRELGTMLVIGSVIAAAIQVFVPRELIFNLGQDTVTSILAMMLLAVIVSVCSTVDSFFALSFASTFTGGSLLAFLVFGPTIDIKSIGLMASIFKPKIIVYIFTIVAQLTFIFALAYSYFF